MVCISTHHLAEDIPRCKSIGVQGSLDSTAAMAQGWQDGHQQWVCSIPGVCRSAAVGLLHPWQGGLSIGMGCSWREGCWVCWRLLDGRTVKQGEPGRPAAPEQGGDGVSR